MVRIKHRYLLVRILTPDATSIKPNNGLVQSQGALPNLVQFHQPNPDELTPQLLAKAIRDHVLHTYGDYGLGLVSSSLNVKYLSPATSTTIIRCARAHYRLVWAALSFMTQLPRTSKQGQPRPCVMQVVRVSGTIKKVEEEAIRRAKAAILQAKKMDGTDGHGGLMALLRQDEKEDAPEASNARKRKMTASLDISDDEEMEMDSDEND